MDLKNPRDGERLVDVRMDKHGNTRVHKYTTSSSRVTIDGVRAKEPHIKRILLGNSGKPATLETSSLTEFSKYVFQEQGICDSRESGTYEVSNSRMCGVRESGFGEEAES
jgi:hypothetical protein